jgi:hypothetical protein
LKLFGAISFRFVWESDTRPGGVSLALLSNNFYKSNEKRKTKTPDSLQNLLSALLYITLKYNIYC